MYMVVSSGRTMAALATPATVEVNKILSEEFKLVGGKTFIIPDMREGAPCNDTIHIRSMPLPQFHSVAEMNGIRNILSSGQIIGLGKSLLLQISFPFRSSNILLLFSCCFDLHFSRNKLSLLICGMFISSAI